MKTLTKEEFRKKLQRKVIMGRILSLILLLGLGYSYLHALDDLQEGILVGLLLGISWMTIRYNTALRRKERFKQLYIQAIDERNQMLDEKARSLLLNILLLLGACLLVLSMVFPLTLTLGQFLSLTLSLVLVLYYLLRFILSKCY